MQAHDHNGTHAAASARTPAADLVDDGARRGGPEGLDFRALFEAMPGNVLVLAPDAPHFTMLAASDAWLATLGTTREAAVGRPLFAVFAEANPEDPAPSGEANIRASLETVLRTRSPHRMALQRYDVQRPDGAWEARWWAPQHVPVLAPDGAVRYLVQHAEDVTGRVRDREDRLTAERLAAALAESEARFRAVQDASPLGFALHRPVREGGRADGRVVDFTTGYLNDAALRITGQSRERVLAGTVLELWPGTEAEGVFADYVRVLETGEPSYRELLYEHDGIAAGLAFNVVRIGEGPYAEVAGTFADITPRLRAEAERKRLAAAVTAERERLWAVLEQLPVPLALLEGPELRHTLVNAAYRRYSGGGRDVTGLTPAEAYPELVGSGFFELMAGVYATGAPWVGPETPVRYDRDGTGPMDTWFDVRYVPVRDAAGAVVGILNVAVDLTGQVLARREVERLLGESETLRAEAEAANRGKGEFLAVMSHELRTPLNAIGGYTELIELGIHGPVTDAQRAALARIQVSQRHLLGLIAGVLDYSRVEAGAVTYRLADVPVAEAVAEAEALVGPQLRAKGLGFAWSGAPPGLCVRADREKLQQVLLNLLGNAIKFTQARDGVPGRIEVTCTVAAASDGPASGVPAGESAAGCVRLHVRDTGVGIPPEHLERIFEPFVQADQRLTRPQEGVGLGLAISRDLARGMGGDLTAESSPGVGSTFTLTLPAVT